MRSHREGWAPDSMTCILISGGRGFEHRYALRESARWSSRKRFVYDPRNARYPSLRDRHGGWNQVQVLLAHFCWSFSERHFHLLWDQGCFTLKQHIGSPLDQERKPSMAEETQANIRRGTRNVSSWQMALFEPLDLAIPSIYIIPHSCPCTHMCTSSPDISIPYNSTHIYGP